MPKAKRKGTPVRYLFYFCDPVASFSEGSRGRRLHRIFGSSGEAKLSSDAWRIGARAYEAVCAACGGQASLADLKDFIEQTRPLLEDFFTDMTTGALNGRISLLRPDGKAHEQPLKWEEASWSWQMQTMLRVMVEVSTMNAAAHIVEAFGPYFAIAALCELDAAALSSISDDPEGVADSIICATWLMDQLTAVGRVADAAKTLLGKLDSERASMRARARHARDPRQVARAFVHECWLAWQAKPEQYVSAAAFARAMIDKEPDTLKSEVVITRWVREWAKRER